MARISDPDRPDHWPVEYHNRHAGASKGARLTKRRHRRREYNKIGRQMVQWLRQRDALARLLSP